MTSPISSNVIHSLTLVRQCINGDVCSNFKNYFEVTNHGRVTRNLGYLLKLPQLKRAKFLSGSFVVERPSI